MVTKKMTKRKRSIIIFGILLLFIFGIRYIIIPKEKLRETILYQHVCESLQQYPLADEVYSYPKWNYYFDCNIPDAPDRTNHIADKIRNYGGQNGSYRLNGYPRSILSKRLHPGDWTLGNDKYELHIYRENEKIKFIISIPKTGL